MPHRTSAPFRCSSLQPKMRGQAYYGGGTANADLLTERWLGERMAPLRRRSQPATTTGCKQESLTLPLEMRPEALQQVCICCMPVHTS